VLLAAERGDGSGLSVCQGLGGGGSGQSGLSGGSLAVGSALLLNQAPEVSKLHNTG
jgi:hypothetical protein